MAAVQAICDGLTAEAIDGLVRKWLARLPHPFTPADRAAGYRYELSVLQAEFSLTQVLDKPVSGRIFFEQTIRDNLDIGRPDRVALIFARQVRRNTPGVFRTRVITDTVTPSLHIDYKHCQIKQYHKHGRALRTETTINDTYDFAIGRRLTNLPALREIGFTPTDACCASNDSATTPPMAPTPSPRSPTRSPPTPGSGCPGCGSPTPAPRRCSRRSACSACCPAASPTATYATTWHPNSRCAPRT